MHGRTGESESEKWIDFDDECRIEILPPAHFCVYLAGKLITDNAVAAIAAIHPERVTGICERCATFEPGLFTPASLLTATCAQVIR